MQETVHLNDEAFTRVWDRVTAALSEQLTPQQEQRRAENQLQQAEGAQLRQLLEQTQRLTTAYGRLIGRGASMRRSLGTLYAARCRSVQRLRLEHYLYTGESLPQPAGLPPQPGILTALRAVCLEESGLERVFRDAACRTGSAELASLYLEQADMAHAHTHALRRLLEGLLE